MQNYILENLPFPVAIFIVVIGALVFVVWWARGMWEKINSLPCKDHKTSLNTHSEKLDSISNSLSDVRGRLDILIGIVSNGTQMQMSRNDILSSDSPTLSEKHSPRVLNQNGTKIFDLLNLSKFLENNREWLAEELAKFKPKTALDVEIFANTALIISSSDDRFNNLKDLIYKSASIVLSINGEEKNYDITLPDVLHVLSIPLRDYYLSLHPEIKVDV